MKRLLVAVAAVVAVAAMALSALDHSVEGHETQPMGCGGTEHRLADGSTLCVVDGQ